MNPNPYEAPGPDAADSPRAAQVASERLLFLLAAGGAILASLYWAALTLLIGLAAAFGSLSPAQLVLPCVLIALYAYRGFQLFKGDPNAAKRILWLHGAGGVVAIFQMAAGGGMLLLALQGTKVAIHIFGAVTAYLALRASQRAIAI